MTLPLLDLGQSKLKGALIKGSNKKNFILKAHRTNAIMKVMTITPHYDVIRVILRQKVIMEVMHTNYALIPSPGCNRMLLELGYGNESGRSPHLIKPKLLYFHFIQRMILVDNFRVSLIIETRYALYFQKQKKQK